MGQFDPINFLNKIASNIANSYANQRNSQARPELQNQRTESLFLQGVKNLSQGATNPPAVINTQNQIPLPSNLKITLMDVEQQSNFVKNMLNLPEDFKEFISQLADGSKNAQTKYDAALIKNSSNTFINLALLSQMLGENSKEALQKLIQGLANASRAGINDAPQLKELIKILTAFSTAFVNQDASQTIKNFMLLYLPYLPLSAKTPDGPDFDIDIYDKVKNETNEKNSKNIQFVTVMIKTVNFSNVKAVLEMQDGGSIEIVLFCNESFPKEKVLALLKHEAQGANVNANIGIEQTKSLVKNEDKQTGVEISSATLVSPQLMLMVHSLIRIITQIDIHFSEMEESAQSSD